jgi:hypothetical protein
MATTIRQLRRYVQKIAKKSNLSSGETKLLTDCIVGICNSGSCKVSDIVRALHNRVPFRQETRQFYDLLSDPKAEFEQLRDAWLQLSAPNANRMPFIAVDPSEFIKRYGKDFDCLATIRDASDPDKRLGNGFSSLQIDATDDLHRNLPLWQETYSTMHPQYRNLYDFVGRAMLKVLSRVGLHATWLFDRGFDAADFYRILHGLCITWVVRQLGTRNVLIGNHRTILMSDLAASLDKPHVAEVPYVDKKSHQMKSCPVRFCYTPVRLPGQSGRFFMVVITGLRSEDMILLTNKDISSVRQARCIVRAYMRRWGVEEGIRFWKQKTGVEDFRVRNWHSIRRLTFFSMLACGIQALWLLTRPAMAERLIARVKVFIKDVPFKNYRLWDGVQDALRSGA